MERSMPDGRLGTRSVIVAGSRCIACKNTGGTAPDARLRQFITANTALMAPPHVPEISLHLAHEAFELWNRTEEELEEIGLPPPFWAFAWAGGQGLARYVLNHGETVRGKTVLDFASGSGIVGIAAAMAGAGAVTASDIDPYAVEAIALNAEVNNTNPTVTGADLIGGDAGWDVVLAGDVFYERELASALANWFLALSKRGAIVLVGDPGRAYLPKDNITCIASYDVAVTRALEDAEVKRTRVWRLA